MDKNSKFVRFAVKHGPKVLVALGTVNLCGSIIFAVKKTPDALELIQHEIDVKRRHGDESEMTKKEIVKTTWKCYIPTAVLGLSSVLCFVGANSIYWKQYTGIAAAYEVTKNIAKEYHDYKEIIKEKIGEKEEEVVRSQVAQIKEDTRQPHDNVIILGETDSLYMDSISGRLFKSDPNTLQRAINDVNQIILKDNEATLNDLYEEIDSQELECTVLGDRMGWEAPTLVNVNQVPFVTKKGQLAIELQYDPDPWELYH